MFLVWAALSGLYAYETVKLLAAGDRGGGLIVGALAVGLAVLCWRSFQKRKRKRAQRGSESAQAEDET